MIFLRRLVITTSMTSPATTTIRTVTTDHSIWTIGSNVCVIGVVSIIGEDFIIVSADSDILAISSTGIDSIATSADSSGIDLSVISADSDGIGVFADMSPSGITFPF